jgi:hypothetical protein
VAGGFFDEVLVVFEFGFHCFYFSMSWMGFGGVVLGVLGLGGV